MNVKYIGTMFIVVLMASCGKWLDVVPKNLVTEEDLFHDGTGYRNALNGIYKQLASDAMYGRELSYGAIDALGQSYISGTDGLPEASSYSILMSLNYEKTEVKGLIEKIWKKSFNAIANCNNIIRNITNDTDKKFLGAGQERKLILGEALALRGYIHFDMLRLFGAAPIKNSTQKYMPYYTVFPEIYEPNRSVAEIMTLIKNDLLKAQELVASYDTLTVDRYTTFIYSQRFRNFDKDVFFGYRGYRFNYPAICATLARVYNYEQKHDLAFEQAQKVINFTNLGTNKIFYFTSVGEVEGNRKLAHDVIVAASDPKLYFNYSRFTKTGANDEKFVMSYPHSIFDDGGDYRGKQLLETSDMVHYRSVKNIVPKVPNDDSEMVSSMIPLIRLSEMYYITAEYYANLNQFDDAATALDAVRIGRGCNKGKLVISDTGSFRRELFNEVFREFFGEGQTFYYYKKLAIDLVKNMDQKLFVLPLPDSQVIN